ncbi:hypothetical protein [Bacillus marinisedimentorum]|uniref:hypothetical protein n=1 Tax=Bacillus marinisedimentorum TaxID=1821260 RepID=UPI0007E20172|nr:hypothetical protein [Bacillus marinisedimentorum]
MQQNKNVPIPYENLRTLYKERITVAEIAEPLARCRSDEPAVDVFDRLDKRQFEVVGIVEQGSVCGYAKKEDLLAVNVCGEAKKLFSPRDIITSSMPLIEIFGVLKHSRSTFVLDERRDVYIITRSDLQKIPVRMLLFGLVSLIELHMLRIIRSQFPNREWQQFMTPGRLQKAHELLELRRERTEAIDLADCLQFSDKKEIIVGSDMLRQKLGFPSKKKGRAIFEGVESLRDKLAHAQDLVIGTTWSRLFDIIESSEGLLAGLEKCK